MNNVSSTGLTPPTPGSNIMLESFTMAEAPSENAMHFRPYETRADAATIGELDSVTRGGTNLSAQALSRVAGRIIAPATQTHGRISIPNGWNTKRFSWTGVWSSRDAFGNVCRETASGYTDYIGVTASSGAMDPNMAFYITSHSSAKPQIHGNKHVYTQAQRSNLLQPVRYTNRSNVNSVANTPLRPRDAMAVAETNMAGGLPSNYSDGRIMMVGGYTPSRAMNNSPVHYLERTLNTFKEAVNTNLTYGDSSGDMYNVSTAAESPALSEDVDGASPLFARIKMGSRFDQTMTVKLSEFRASFPNFDSVIRVTLIPPRGMHDKTNITQHLGGTTIETSIYNTLSQSIPALMGTLMVGMFGFIVDNRAAVSGTSLTAGVINCQCTGMQCTIKLEDESRRMAIMVDNIRTVIAPQILAYGIGDFVVSGNINMMGSCELLVSVNGQKAVPFSTPMYVLNTPVLGATKVALDTLSTDIAAVVTNVIKTPPAATSAYDLY